MSEPPRDWIFVSELRLLARVGVNPGERGAEQPIVLDLQVAVDDMDQAAHSESLRDTLDYVTLARTARRVVERRHYPLVETLATRIAEAILALPAARKARVRLRKLHCLRRASAAGVEVELESHQVRPSLVALEPAELAEQQEVVVVGGGAAGLAACLWCWRLGHPALLVEPAPEACGQLDQVHGQMTDLPGMPPMAGARLARRLLRQFIWHGGRVVRARLERCLEESGRARLELRGVAEPWTRTLRAEAAILCVGIRRRELQVPGERRLAGRGILQSGARDTERQAGQRVAVVGGGDAAVENALLLARAGARVILVHRGSRLSCLAHFRRTVQAEPGIEVRLGARVRRFLGQEQLEGLELERAVEADPAAEPELLPVDAALVRIGWLPNNEALPAPWLDQRGYARVDATGRVQDARRFFAAGDIAGPVSSSVAGAFGTAATAARGVVRLLESVE